MPNSANLSGTSLGPTLIRRALASQKAPCTKKLEAVQVKCKVGEYCRTPSKQTLMPITEILSVSSLALTIIMCALGMVYFPCTKKLWPLRV